MIEDWTVACRGGLSLRVWDVHPGYLSRSRLLGEHREIHAVATILTQGKQGYSNHPETRRWRGQLGRLCKRHLLVETEMRLRGYQPRSPIAEPHDSDEESQFCCIDPPHEQFAILRGKYGPEESGRMPLPTKAHEFWAHHKYSVMARGYGDYSSVSHLIRTVGNQSIADAQHMVDLVYSLLARETDEGNLRNAWQHVLGYLKHDVAAETIRRWQEYIPHHTGCLGRAVYQAACAHDKVYLQQSTIVADPISLADR